MDGEGDEEVEVEACNLVSPSHSFHPDELDYRPPYESGGRGIVVVGDILVHLGLPSGFVGCPGVVLELFCLLIN